LSLVGFVAKSPQPTQRGPTWGVGWRSSAARFTPAEIRGSCVVSPTKIPEETT